jgi:hypothetical protein
MPRFIPRTLREILLGTARTTALPLKEHVADWIVDCRTIDKGLPMFRTHYAGEPFREKGEFFVLGVCYSGPDIVKSKWFRQVPPEDFAYLVEHTDDYRYLLQKYGTEEHIKKALPPWF